MKNMKNRGIKSLSSLLCFSKQPDSKILNYEEITTDPELGFPKKGFGEDGLDSELIRIHNLCGPPRFLFTIMEETKEDLESDDEKSRGERSRKLGDFFGELTEVEMNKALSSPPSRFKFLRDADEKFNRNLLMEEGEKRRERMCNSIGPSPLSF